MTGSAISSITKGPRQSNFELLRLFAMFLVLVVHSDFWILGRPTATCLIEMPVQSFTKVMVESIAIVCVNCFILISGWFGIKATWRGLLGFIFQCLFFKLGGGIVALLTGWYRISINGIWECLLLTPESWFIHSYIGLYIISPVLNIFLEKAPKEVIKSVLIIFYIYQSTFGWLNGAQYFMLGYSAMSFCGLYLLAGYIRRYYILPNIQISGWKPYALSIVCNSMLYYIVTFIGFPLDVYAYCNPLVVVGSIGLLLMFNNVKIKPDEFVNRIALSAFAVYLFHTEANIGVVLFKSFITDIYNNYSGLAFLLLVGLVLLSFYIFAILLDQPRYYIWRYLSKFFSKSNSFNIPLCPKSSFPS